MRIPRFYCSIPLTAGDTIQLPDTTFRHAVQVLRLKSNEALVLFNGEGGEYLARMQQVERRKASVSIEAFQDTQPESPTHITLALAMIKPDKMDFAIQKSVELGVTEIQPLITQRSVVKVGKDKMDKKLQHWQGVAIAACEQSGRTHIPNIHLPLALEKYLQQDQRGTCITLDPTAQQTVASLDKDLIQPITLVIGPEGGFTDEEVALFDQQATQRISLGKRILRAETACLTAVTLLQHHYGDLQ